MAYISLESRFSTRKTCVIWPYFSKSALAYDLENVEVFEHHGLPTSGKERVAASATAYFVRVVGFGFVFGGEMLAGSFLLNEIFLPETILAQKICLLFRRAFSTSSRRGFG